MELRGAAGLCRVPLERLVRPFSIIADAGVLSESSSRLDGRNHPCPRISNARPHFYQ